MLFRSDIACRGSDCYLLEYQGLHFGLTTADKGKFFYEHTNRGWIRHEGRIAIEEEMADAMLVELAERGWNINASSRESSATRNGGNK